MADGSGRNVIGARRVPSAALSEDYYTFIRSGGGGPTPGSGPGTGTYTSSSSHSLRPAPSRFSLRDQFSTTRREIEFGFDDASSVLERCTIASEADLDNEFDETVLVNSSGGVVETSSLILPPPRPSRSSPTRRDHYELLCLPRDSSLTPDEIRKAFHRVVLLLCVDRQPKRLQAAAASYLYQVQIAFETLIEPYKRAEYDRGLSVDNDDGTYQASVMEQYMLLGPGGLRTSTDLGMRLDATSLLDQTGRPTRQKRSQGLSILDFSLGQSITTNVPALRDPFERTIIALRDFAEKQLSGFTTKRPLYCADPTITIAGSTHGLMDEPFKLASLLRDPYHPPGPSIHGRRRLDQLLSSRFIPVLNVTTRQEMFLHEPSSPPSTIFPRRIPDSVLEQELEILPHPSVTLRAGHSITLPENPEPLNIEVSIQKFLTSPTTSPPTIGLALDQKLGPGTAFLVADAGDWTLWPSKECRELSKFSEQLSPSPSRFTNRLTQHNPFRNTIPTIEAGYTFGSSSSRSMGVRSGRAFTRPSDRGLRAMDHDSIISTHTSPSPSPSSWTVSTGLTTLGTAAVYLRYGLDLFFTSPSPSSPSPANPYIPTHKTGLRAEIELTTSTTTASKPDLLLAFRTLKYIGRFSKIGLEVGITPHNLHLSLYWSRLGQRVSIPLLIASGKGSSGKVVFWTTVVPFLGVAIWEGWRGWWKRVKGNGKGKRGGKGVKKGDKAVGGLEAGAGPGAGTKTDEIIAKQRAEADELTVILATGVEPRQRAERHRGGLVILSAKYGVMSSMSGGQIQVQNGGGGGDGEVENEIADVTVAVAAMVDDEGRLKIPGGLRKGRLLGFWDPNPDPEDVGVGVGVEGEGEGGGRKTLWVRYMYRGREGVVEVGEWEGVSLP